MSIHLWMQFYTIDKKAIHLLDAFFIYKESYKICKIGYKYNIDITVLQPFRGNVISLISKSSTFWMPLFIATIRVFEFHVNSNTLYF